MIDHVDIRVADRAASQRFYAAVFAALGRTGPGPTDDGECLDWGPFAIVADDRPVTRHLHVVFSAPSQELVAAVRRLAPDGGVLRDPDGNTIDVACPGEPGAIAHLRLRTRDVAAVRRFHLATGHELAVDDPDHVQVRTATGSISSVTSEPPTEHVHFAFGVETNAAVDAFHRAAIAAGYTDNGPPGERAAYHPGYYAAFVLDPDGHNVEAVNHNRTPATSA